MSQKIDIRERRFNGADYDTLHPETNINMVLDSSNNSVGSVKGALYGDGNGNIVGAAISNPNLLDNPWFTVNQRGATSGTERTYIADRWYLDYGNGGVTWSRTANTITIQSTNGASYGEVYQVLTDELVNSINGKIVTVSVMLNDFSVISTSFLFSTGSDISKLIGNGLDGNSIYFNYFDAVKRFRIRKNYTAETIRAVKLEIGSVSTLANDVAPNYTTELLKCQRYFVRLKASNNTAFFGYGVVSADNVAGWAIINIPEMRIVPTMTVSGAFRTLGQSIGNITAMSLGGVTTGLARIDITGTGMGTKGQPFIIGANSDINAYIDFSADL